MSVLNQSGEEQVECPLCMEPLEVDDLNFYPCTCGYQICRFCWHRIRTDENGLCPACRKAYSENPADFTPLSKEQVAQLKAEKRARDQQRKAKLSESRKHLAAVRVVQKNLVFVVGLPVRLADADVLKRHEYFGKFGKIHKVVINQSTSYAGSQGPSASAYVTYVKSDDALRAIESVNNIMLDGRLIKSSLGTTKYCSHFMKNQPCPKADCMYLHDFGDPEASFTKEQMHVGKHQEYEKKLHDSLQTRMQAQQQIQQQTSQLQNQTNNTSATTTQGAGDKGTDRGDKNSEKGKEKGKDWPTLHGDTNSGGFGTSKTEKPQKSESKPEKSQKKSNQKNKNNNNNTNSTNNNIETTKKSEKSKNCEQVPCSQTPLSLSPPQQIPTPPETELPTPQTQTPSPPATDTNPTSNHATISQSTADCRDSLAKMQLIDDNSSFFSHNSFQKILPEDSSAFSDNSTPHTNHILNDNLPDITSSEDWQAAFGFSTNLKQNGAENGFPHNQNGFVNHLENFQKNQQNYDLLKTRDSILDVLGRNSHFLNGYKENDRNPYLNLHKPENGLTNGLTNGLSNGLSNGLDQQMSKFFAEFNKNGHSHPQNGFVERQNFLGNQLEQQQQQQHNMLLLNYQQRVLDKQLEDQALYNLKQNVFQQQQQQQQHPQQHSSQYIHNHGSHNHGLHHNSSQQFLNNGEHFQNFGNTAFPQNSVFQNPSHQLRGPTVDDDLGFDPFHETQKALAELIESEQGTVQHNIQNQSLLAGNTAAGGPGTSLGGPAHHLAPPPGFVQHNTHMNSFGSKILPFLNMSNSQQINSSGGWSANHSEAQLKGLAPVNDWMTLDPAIVSSSRHFPLANLPLREQFPPSLFQQSPQARGAPFDFPTQHNGYSQSQQPQNPHISNYSNGYNTHHTQSGLNWFANDLQGVNGVSSPPGFRPASKTQEC